jgi:hypothetical protein
MRLLWCIFSPFPIVGTVFSVVCICFAVDTATATVSPTSLTTAEASGIAMFNLVLDSQPSASVTIAVSSSDVGEGTVSASSLVFATGAWNTPQTVTVTGVSDDMVDGDIGYTIQTGVCVSSDANFNTGVVADVSATSIDGNPIVVVVACLLHLVSVSDLFLHCSRYGNGDRGDREPDEWHYYHGSRRDGDV